MKPLLEENVTRQARKTITWNVVIHGSMSGSPGAVRTLSDGELATAAAESGAFRFLEHPDEDIYSLEDGREV